MSFLLVLLSLLPISAAQRREQTFGFTLDFEEGDLRGWTPTGTAFNFQPTLGDNTMARGAGNANLQGQYWVGTYERYQGLPAQSRGGIQGDRPTGTLTSAPFKIPNGTLNFLIGGGSSFETRAELVLVERDSIENVDIEKRILFASGHNSEAMTRITWDLAPYAGKTGKIRIVDGSVGSWGHINVDDFRFGTAPSISDAVPSVSGKIAPPTQKKRPTPSYSVSLKADDTNPPKGKNVHFAVAAGPEVKISACRFDFGDGTPTEWISAPETSHVYKTAGVFNAFLRARIGREEIQSPVVPIQVVEPTLTLRSLSGTQVAIGQPVRFEARAEPAYPGLQYQFQYEDERTQARNWVSESQQDHRFIREGSYRVIALARTIEKLVLRSNVITVQVSPAPVTTYSMRLSAEPDRIRVGDSVNFRAFLSPEAPAAEYRFQFGDDTDLGWSPESQMRHTYRRSGSFHATVSARSAGQVIAASIPIGIEVMRPAYKLVLEVERTDPYVGERIRFQGRFEPSAEVTEYRIDFGDGTPMERLRTAEVRHAYRGPGLFVAVLSARIGQETITSEKLNINVRRIPLEVVIAATPSRAKPNAPVSFKASVQPATVGLNYQFVYGDDEIRDWSQDSTATHAYTSKGTYHAYVNVRFNQEPAYESARIPVLIEPPSPFVLWGGVGAILVLLFGGGALIRSRISRRNEMQFRAMFRAEPRKDIGVQQIGPESAPQPDYDFCLKAVGDQGEQEIETDRSLVFLERRGS